MSKWAVEIIAPNIKLTRRKRTTAVILEIKVDVISISTILTAVK